MPIGFRIPMCHWSRWWQSSAAPMSADANPRLAELHDAGVSIWLDTLSRDLLESGRFAELISDYSVTGATSNPTIFAKAITNSERYDAQIAELAADGVRNPREVFFALALDDVRRAECDDQGPRHRGRTRRDRRADRARRQRQCHAPLRGRPLRAGHRGLPARARGTRRRRRVRCRNRVS